MGHDVSEPLATLGIGILAAIGLYRYWKAIGGDAGAVARKWVNIMLWVMPALLLTGAALLFSSPLNPPRTSRFVETPD
jgi:hypothetical protein